MGDQPTAMDVENDDRDPEPVAADSLPSSSEADDADDSLQDGEDSGPSLEADDDLDSPTTSAPAAAESNAPASTSTTSGAPSRPPGPGGRSALRTVVPPLIPLGKRPAPSSSHPAAPAAAATAPTSASQPAAKVKRARRTQRCGKCAPCLNPHWKKACLEVRREEDPQRAAPAPKKPVEAEDPFVRTLRTIMAPSGGITQTKHVRILLDLMKRAGSLAQRSALLQVLQNSTPEVQELAVQQRLLLLLQSWLAPAIDGNKPKNATRIVECLATLPVTIPALQPPCELGKLVGKLRRAEGFEIAHLPARQLVAKWKALIEQAASSSAPRKEAAGPAKATSTTSGASAAPTAVVAAAKAPSAAPVAHPAVQRQQQQPATGEAPAASGIAGGRLDDGDIFGVADRQRAKELTLPKPATTALPDTSALSTSGTVPARHAAPQAPPPAASLAAAKAPASAAAAKGPPDSAAASGTNAARAASAARVSASPLDSFTPPSTPSSSSFSSGVTVLGGSSVSLDSAPLSRLYRTAAERARDAAARIPSPEPPAQRKPKAKKVGWAEGDRLVAVRWFRKADAPVAAQADADDSQPAAREPSPPRFASAAKQEHLSEADALRTHRLQEDHEKSEVVTRLAAMRATVPWYDPPHLAAVVVARGEESEEASIALARRRAQPPVVQPGAVYPLEPVGMTDNGLVQHPSTIPHIPLSVEEAMRMQQQREQQQWQPQPQWQPPAQGQQHYHHPPPAQSMPAPLPAPAQPHASGPMPMRSAFHPQQSAPLPPHHTRYHHHHQQQQAETGPPPSAALPTDIGAAIAQLAASGVIGGVGNPPQQLQPPVMQANQYPHQQPVDAFQQRAPGVHAERLPSHAHHQPPQHHHQQQRQRLPQQVPHRPVLPPGMKPMLGLHRPAQPADAGPAPNHPQHPQHPQHSQQQGGGGGAHPPPSQFRSKTPCRFYHTKEGCRHGDSCRFVHLPMDDATAGKRPRVDEGPDLSGRRKQQWGWSN